MASPAGTPAVLEQARARLLQGDALGARELIASSGVPQNGPVLHLAGLTAAVLSDFPAAITLLRQSLALNPANRRWKRDLAVALTAGSCFGEAETLLAELASEDPGSLDLAAAHAAALLRCGRATDAAEACRRSLDMCPDHPRTLLTLGQALIATESYPEAAAALEACLSIKPGQARAWDLLGDIRSHQIRPFAAMECREAAYRLQPNDIGALARVAWARFQTGDLDKAIADCRALIATGEATPETRSACLRMLLHDPAQDARTLRQEHERLSDTHATPALPVLRHAPPRREKTRIGYVWGEAANSPFRHFLSPLLSNHDRSAFDISLYATSRTPDSGASQFTQYDVGHLSPSELAEKIRADGAHILIDLTGHYFHQSLDLFAHRAAPVQAAFPNYPCTTGAPGVDYIFTDRWVCPPGSEYQYSEEPRFLPSGYLAWEPPAVLPLRTGHSERLTFGLFQRPAKYNPRFWDTVAAILTDCSGSALLVHYYSAELDEPDSRPSRNIYSELAQRGISADRVILRGARPLREHLALLAEADIALDTFPYNGQTTTCECLWMGVPVVTLTGEWHVARVGFELVSRAGLSYLAADSTTEYVRTAVRLAADPDALATGRERLRSCLRSSPVMDGAALARGMEQEIRLLLKIHENQIKG